MTMEKIVSPSYGFLNNVSPHAAVVVDWPIAFCVCVLEFDNMQQHPL